LLGGPQSGSSPERFGRVERKMPINNGGACTMRDLETKGFERFRVFYPFESKQESLDFVGLFDFEEGWKDVIWKLHVDLEKLHKKAKRDVNYWGLQIIRIDRSNKGGIHVEHLGATQEMKDRIGKAEGDSWKICEVCGEAGQSAKMIGNPLGNLDPVFRVLCEVHAKMRGFQIVTPTRVSGF
jgi:hypothetical protein